MDNFKLYRIVNRHTGEMYFGITSMTFKARWREHMRQSLKKKPKGYLKSKLAIAITDYGPSAFLFEIIIECECKQEILHYEACYINAYKTIDNGYNRSTGSIRNGYSTIINAVNDDNLQVPDYKLPKRRTKKNKL